MQPNSDQQPAQPKFVNRLRESIGVGLQERLLPSNQKRLSAHSVAGLCDLNLDDEGSNRRSIGLLPLPATRQDHELTETDTLRLQQLLVSIEARKLSCCIRVFSNGSKSRSAILVYRGRLIGCVFGKRANKNQSYGKAAFEQILDNLVSAGNVIDAYLLSDEMVLASASLFHGGLIDASYGVAAATAFSNCAQMMIKSRRTGCLVATSGDSAIVVAYIFEGQITGVYSFADGWLTKTQAAVLNCLEYMSGADILMSLLPDGGKTPMELTESLSGLDLAGLDAAAC